MAESYEDLPPPYSEPLGNYVSTSPVVVGSDDITTAFTTQIAIGVLQQARHSEGRHNANSSHIVRSTDRHFAASHHVMGVQNTSNSFSGFLDIMHENKKLPWGFAKNMIYKLGLFVYYLANFVFFIVAVAVQKEDVAYHLVYIAISLTGFIFEFIVVMIDVRLHLTQSGNIGEGTRQGRLNQVTHTNQPRLAWTADTQVQDYYCKAKGVFQDYVISSLGEFLIYPTLICTLYGFINERAWKFNDGISGCYVFFLVYGVIMDAIYTKVYVVYLVMRVIGASYAKYDELVRPTEVEWKRYFTPVYLTIPFTIVTALTHWFMIEIIGVRIYIDNFTPVRDVTNSFVPDTGDYRVTPLTGCMIGCTVYLPIVSWIVYIILNKLWFYDVFSAINQLTTRADCMPPCDSWDKKLFAFIRNYLSYIASVFLIIPFILFTVGAYLPDYDSSDHEVASSARNALQGLGPCFIILFLLSNFQAAIISIIIVLLTVTLMLCGLPILCGVMCYKCCDRQSGWNMPTYNRSFY